MSTTTPVVPLLPENALASTYGALYISVVVAAMLFGLTNLQAFLYLRIQSPDNRSLIRYKAIVCWLWLLDAFHLALITQLVYFYLVEHFGDVTILDQIVWSFKLQIVVDVLVVYSVHCLYAYRLYLMSRGRGVFRKFAYLAGTIVLLGSGVAIALCWAVYRANVYPTLVTQTQWATYMALGSIVAIDSVLASSMCYLFHVSRTGFDSTDSVLRRLMRYVIQTGVLTSLCSLSAMICLAVMPNNFIFLGLEFFITKLYVNSFLALLNATHHDRKSPHMSSAQRSHSSSHNAGEDRHHIADHGEAKLSSVILISKTSAAEASADAYPPKPRPFNV